MEFKRIKLDLSNFYQILLAMLMCLVVMVFLVIIGVVLVYDPFNHSSGDIAVPSKVVGKYIIFLSMWLCILFGSMAIKNIYKELKCAFHVRLQNTLEYNKEFLFNWYAEVKNLKTFEIKADKFDYELDRCFYKTSSGKTVNITLGEIYKLYLQYEKNAAR